MHAVESRGVTVETEGSSLVVGREGSRWRSNTAWEGEERTHASRAKFYSFPRHTLFVLDKHAGHQLSSRSKRRDTECGRKMNIPQAWYQHVGQLAAAVGM